VSRGPVHIHIACGTGPVYIHLDTSTPLERKVTGGSYPRQPRQEHVSTFNLPLTVPEYGAHRAPSPLGVDFEHACVPHYFEGGRT